MKTSLSSCRKKLRAVALVFFSAVLLSGAGGSVASVNIAQVPLFVTAGVEPNIMFIIDDSGSMQWETMPDELTNIFNVSCCTDYLMWTFPRIAGLHGGSDYSGATQVISFRSTDIMARAGRSSLVNTVYYNPAVTYRPWVNADGTAMPDAPPDAAPNRPLYSTFGTRDLTSDFSANVRWVDTRAANSSSSNRTVFPAVYSTYVGPPVPNVLAAISDSTSSLWTLSNYTWTEIRPATPNYQNEGRENRSDCVGASATPPTCTYAEEIQNFANWYTYHRNRIFTARGGIGRAFVDFGAEMRVGFGAINTQNMTVDSVSGNTVRRGVRPFVDTPTLNAKSNFFSDLYSIAIPTQGTPLRRALEGAGEYFTRSDRRGPWSDTPGVNTSGENIADHLTCRQSFSILMTDGYTSGGSDNAATGADRRANVDGTVLHNTTNVHPDNTALNFTYTPSDPFQDSRANTLADVAMYYWKRDLRPDLDNRVPPSGLNPAFWQHMVTYGVGLGVGGSIDPVDAWDALENGTAITWPNPNFGTTNCSAAAGECAARVDDLLHAAVNSRGGFFSASDPDTFAAELRGVLSDIVARVETSGSAAATSSAVLQTDTLLYTASFRSTDWSGNLIARAIAPDGKPLAATKFSVEDLLAARLPADRDIFTTRDDGVPASLTWAGLSGSGQQAALGVNPPGTPITSATGQDRLQWLRGVEHPGLRDRLGAGVTRRLGSLVGSDPQFMFRREFGFGRLPGVEGSSYATFRQTTAYRSRPDVIFVGSNGGMLHAFHAGTPFIDDPADLSPNPAQIMNPLGGKELFAYVPSELLLPRAGSAESHAQINELMVPDYSHRYYVDGTATWRDAYVGGVWKTVLVGTMGAGGRTVFALNVTDPENFQASDVMWEFGYADEDCSPGVTACREVGYGITQPSIARLEDGTWVAIFGNGYNSASNRAQLFVVELATGELVEAIDTGVGSGGAPNGLAVPTVSVWPPDPASPFSAARAYAGDLAGNMWRFKLSAPMSVSRFFTATGPSGAAQPITARPAIAAYPGDVSKVVVTFGTGSFFQVGDNNPSLAQTQTMYGVFDTQAGESNVVRSDLLQQTLVTNGSAVTIGGRTYAPNTLRTLSSNALTTQKGWRIDLPLSGERVISEATFPSELVRTRVRFSTLIPDDDRCSSGRSGFLMDFDLASGGSYVRSVFDLSGDGSVDSGDLWGGSVVVGVGGMMRGERVTTIRRAGADLENLYGGDGDCAPGDTGCMPSEARYPSTGRQTWRQIR